MVDIDGYELDLGSIVVAPDANRLYFGVIKELRRKTGTVLVDLCDLSFSVPLEIEYLFPNTQVYLVNPGLLNSSVPMHKMLLDRQQEIFDAHPE